MRQKNYYLEPILERRKRKRIIDSDFMPLGYSLFILLLGLATIVLLLIDEAKFWVVYIYAGFIVLILGISETIKSLKKETRIVSWRKVDAKNFSRQGSTS